MGLLSEGTPMEWKEARKFSGYIRAKGIQELATIYQNTRTRNHDILRWGDEVEYILVEFEEKKAAATNPKRCRVSQRAQDILGSLRLEMNKFADDMKEDCADLHDHIQQGKFSALWQPEYARFQIEGVPAKPYKQSIGDLLCVEKNLLARRWQIERMLLENEQILCIGNFPRLGCKDSFIFHAANEERENDQNSFDNDASRSFSFPDEFINSHPRFKTLTKNIRERKGEKVQIPIPIYRDSKTATTNKVKGTFLDLDMENDLLILDAMGFGMGCCCLQVTFQACSLEEARFLFDQLTALSPLFMAISASTPAYAGFLSDRDCRWSVICDSVDDRRGEEKKSIPKSRYSSTSRYIGSDLRGDRETYLNDLLLPFDELALQELCRAGMDDQLAKHFAWLFTRDPLVIYQEDIIRSNKEGGGQNDDNEHPKDENFENIQSTNWQTMRLKPPNSLESGWRVEFRALEVQPNEFENAAFCVFLVLLCRALRGGDGVWAGSLDFRIPISLVDQNMQWAQARDAVNKESFYFVNSSMEQNVDKLKIKEIFLGSDRVKPGLCQLVDGYLEKLGVEQELKCQLQKYIKFIKDRASGVLPTPSMQIRQFVAEHPAYEKDSVISEEIQFDLLKTLFVNKNEN